MINVASLHKSVNVTILPVFFGDVLERLTSVVKPHTDHTGHDCHHGSHQRVQQDKRHHPHLGAEGKTDNKIFIIDIYENCFPHHNTRLCIFLKRMSTLKLKNDKNNINTI